MALPTKVVEQLGREPVRTPGWSGRVLMFSGTFFLISLATWSGILYGYEPFVNSQNENLKAQIQEFSRKVPVEQQEEIITFYSQLVNLRSLLGRQELSSGMLSWLEENTNTSVQLTSMTYDANLKILNLVGQSRTFTNFAEQLNRFRSQPTMVRSFELGGLAFDTKTGVWTFSLKLTLTPNFLKVLATPPPPVEETLSTENASSTNELSNPQE